MSTRRLTLCLLLTLTCLTAHADWKLDRFMVSAWGGPTDEATAKAYADAGFNTVMCKADQLDRCAKFGLRAIVFEATPEMAAKLKGSLGVWGWYVQDEPKAEEFPKVGERMAAMHAADPDHPGYVNLMAWMDLDKYMTTVKPEFLSYDLYQWWWGSGSYCRQLETHRNAALKYGVPLICWVEANADPRYEWGKPGAGYLPDNMAKLRQSVSLAVAYGVQGIQWFTGGLCFDKDGKRSQSGEDIAQINHELQALGPTLLALKSEAVWHTAPVPPYAKPVPADCWVQSPYRKVTFGLFSGPGGRYALVVNRDLAREREVPLHLNGAVSRLERFNTGAQEWDAAPLTRLNAQTKLALTKVAAGGMVLLRLP